MSDKLTITFLGTSAAIPTIKRGLSSIALIREKQTFLLDCGEGTQRQILLAGIHPSKISTVFISHMHADHILGLPGFMSTQQMLGRTKPLHIVGPVGIKEFVEQVKEMSAMFINYPIKYTELADDEKREMHIGRFTVQIAPLLHRAPCFGYRFVEEDKRGFFDNDKAVELGVPEGPLRKKLAGGESIQINGKTIHSSQIVGPPLPGRIITYCTDTRPCDNAELLAQNANILIFDTTFGDLHSELAVSTFHSTAREAAQLAKKYNVDTLFLWHISSRYGDELEGDLLKQAREEFSNSQLPNDFSAFPVNRRTAI